MPSNTVVFLPKINLNLDLIRHSSLMNKMSGVSSFKIQWNDFSVPFQQIIYSRWKDFPWRRVWLAGLWRSSKRIRTEVFITHLFQK